MTEKDQHILKDKAQELSQYVCLMVNHEAEKSQVNFEYKAKFILEELIKILEEKI